MSDTAYGVADLVAKFIVTHASKRVFRLPGGYVLPICDVLRRNGAAIVDTRNEAAAVHMATAHAFLAQEVGIAAVTVGPGVTNCVTAISNAHQDCAPVVVLGMSGAIPKDDHASLEGTPCGVNLLRPITRYAKALRAPERVLDELDHAVACAIGLAGPPGPVYLEMPTDVLQRPLAPDAKPRATSRLRDASRLDPNPDLLSRASDLLVAARRPLVIGGRDVLEAKNELRALLEESGAVFLDTREGAGAVPLDFPKLVSGRVASAALLDADLILAIGCRVVSIDSQVPVATSLVRIDRYRPGAFDRRAGDVELLADPRIALRALVAALRGRRAKLDLAWASSLAEMQREQRRKCLDDIGAAPPGSDGFARPERIFSELRQVLSSDATVIVDGDGLDNLARLTLPASHYLDSKASGCQGIAIPFANAAALALPGRPVVAVCDAAAFSRFSSELETAVRHECRVVIVVVNSGRSKADQSNGSMSNSKPTQIAETEYPNLAAVGRAFGLHAERVVEQSDLAGALDRAFSRAPALVDVCVTRDTARPMNVT